METLKNTWEESPELVKIIMLLVANVLFGLGFWTMFY